MIKVSIQTIDKKEDKISWSIRREMNVIPRKKEVIEIINETGDIQGFKVKKVIHTPDEIDKKIVLTVEEL